LRPRAHSEAAAIDTIAVMAFATLLTLTLSLSAAAQPEADAAEATDAEPVTEALESPAPAEPASDPPAAAASETPASASGAPPDTQPVVRAAPGNWGMTFIFGGLGPLSVAGLGDQPLSGGLMFTEIGLRRVFKHIVLPFSFGAGIVHRTRPDGPAEVAAGVSGSIAVLKGFRVWRRIAPYFGGFFHAHYIDAPGPDNWLVNLSVGPILGIEYYVADRVSLYGQGIISIGPDITRQSVQMVARFAMAAGGQLGLTFYF
jgi:hypothetical protein